MLPTLRDFGLSLIVSVCFLRGGTASAADAPLQIDVSVAAEGTAEWSWAQARTAWIDGSAPRWFTTMNRYSRREKAAHAFFDVYAITRSGEAGGWSEPVPLPSLARTKTAEGDEIVPADLWPNFHPQSGMVLITGKIFHFDGGVKENILREQVGYAVYDPATETCGPLRVLRMPGSDRRGLPILAPNAGCHQSVLLPDGDLLLPIRYQTSPERRIYTSIVARCRFDGAQLTYVEHGSEHEIPEGRGLYEPSVVEFNGRCFLTMRADGNGHVARSDDGLVYSPHAPWTFDDGQPLGSEHTQQHWLTIGERLFLVYTRRGAGNDHIFRFRAPLFLGQVDPERLCVIRATEQVALPEEGVALGNFGVCRVSDRESWITCAEDAVPAGRPGNRVWTARVRLE